MSGAYPKEGHLPARKCGETEISQFNDTEVLSTTINEQLISIIHIWFCGIEIC